VKRTQSIPRPGIGPGLAASKTAVRPTHSRGASQPNNALARSRTWSTTFGESCANPAHSKDDQSNGSTQSDSCHFSGCTPSVANHGLQAELRRNRDWCRDSIYTSRCEPNRKGSRVRAYTQSRSSLAGRRSNHGITLGSVRSADRFDLATDDSLRGSNKMNLKASAAPQPAFSHPPLAPLVFTHASATRKRKAVAAEEEE
jgi:hypothetical protein